MIQIETERYVRKPLYVEAVQITEENFFDVVEWCQGQIRDVHTDEIIPKDVDYLGQFYIRVRVHSPRTPRQTKGYIGDWILYTDMTYKVYTQKAFESSFEKVKD